MPKSKMSKRLMKVKKVQRGRKRANIRQVHRRLVLFPDHKNSDWLKKLQWFTGIVMKLLSVVIGLDKDGYFDDRTTSSGTTLILGPGDFASVSPYAVPVTSDSTDKEVLALKTFSFERTAMHSVHVRIVPTADASVRGGVYAALIIPIDDVDAQFVFADEKGEDKHKSAELLVQRYSPVYDDILKHPRAKSGAVTSPLTLSIRLRPRYHNIRSTWDDKLGYINAYPRCALLVGFSDLAASSAISSEANYDPSKCLFEVHLRAGISYGEPSEIVISHPKTSASQSCYTPYVLASNRTDQNKAKAALKRTVQYGDFRIETTEPRLHITDVPLKMAKIAISDYKRPELLELLSSADSENEADYQMIG
jgi:hypothetical protein